MLCHLCAALNIDKICSENGSLHHLSIEDLAASAKTGCEICNLIYSEYDKRQKNYSSVWSPSVWVPSEEYLKSISETQIVVRALGYGTDLPEFPIAKIYDGDNKKFNVDVEVFTNDDDPMSQKISGRPLLNKLSHTAVQNLISRWLTECTNDHPLCGPSTKQLPTRVIDVGKPGGIARLIESAGFTGAWVALSHCWGNSRSGITTIENYLSRRTDLDFENLPQMFHDAILITREVGYSYLWIDSICIIQDSAEDWGFESLRMDVYFSGSSLNLSPSCPDPELGIFESVDQRHGLNVPPVSIPYNHEADVNIRPQSTLSLRIRHQDVKWDKTSGLKSRAWVLQETALSRRIVWFDANQIRWHCASCRGNEKQPNRIRKITVSLNARFYALNPKDLAATEPYKYASYNSVSRNRSIAFHWWYGILDDFMGRKITFHSDRLPAISGLAREFAVRTGFHYRCGLWVEDMISGLLWRPYGPFRGNPDTITADSNSDLHESPSWSWVSVTETRFQMVTWCYGFDHEEDDMNHCNVTGFEPSYIDGNIYGRVESAILTIVAPWQYVNHDHGYPAHRFMKDVSNVYDKHDAGTIIFSPDRVVDVGTESAFLENAIFLLLCTRQANRGAARKVLHALILVPIPRASKVSPNPTQEFRRIGIAEFPLNDGKPPEWPIKLFRIR